MPSNARDEYGPIPPDVARCLRAHESDRYAARTEANVRWCNALLVVVQDAGNERATPGTAKTLDLALERRLPRMVVDPDHPTGPIAAWLWHELIRFGP